MSRWNLRGGLVSSNLDLVVVGAVVGITAGVSVLTPTGAVGLPLALVLLFVFPGYVTMALAYAGRNQSRESALSADQPMVSVVERGALSLGLSLAVVPVLGLGTYLSPWSLTETTVVAVVAAYVVVVTILAVIRRGGPVADSNVTDQVGDQESGAGLTVPSPSRLTTTQLLVNGVLVVSILAATATLGMALLAPPQESGTTDLHLLTESDDRLVANDYPEAIESDEEAQVTVGVTNDERTAAEYTVVAELQQVRIDGQSVVVIDEQSVGSYQFALDDGETWRQQLTIEPTLVGVDLRFAVYLYRDEPPERPSGETAYREANLWLDVEPAGVSSSN